MPSLGSDLASIRKQLNVSIDDINRSTKIPVSILNSIEDDSIFTTFDENKTYIRSYVRSYGKALKLDDDQVIRALDQTEAGTYTGFLGKGEESPPSEEEASPAPKEEKKPAQDEEPNQEQEQSPEPISDNSDNEQAPDQQTSAPPTVNSVDWANVGQKFNPMQTKSKIWVVISFILLAVAAAGTYIFYQNYYSGGDNSSQPASDSRGVGTDPSASDSLQLNFTPPSPADDTTKQVQARPQSLNALPDTLKMVIYAAYDILEPVRVYTDVTNGLNPYWIEHGEAYEFDFVNIIRIRGQYSRMELLLNGHLIEDFRQRFLNEDTGMLEIERSVFEGNPKWLQAPPDSLPIDAPPPTIIKERPTFN